MKTNDLLGQRKITMAIRVDIDSVTDVREIRERRAPNTIPRRDIVGVTPLLGWWPYTDQLAVLSEWGYGDVDYYHVRIEKATKRRIREETTT